MKSYISILTLGLLLATGEALGGTGPSKPAGGEPNPNRRPAPAAQPQAQPRAPRMADLEVEALRQINVTGAEALVGVGDFRVKFSETFEGKPINIWRIFRAWAHVPEEVDDQGDLPQRWIPLLQVARTELLRLQRDVLSLYAATSVSSALTRPQVTAQSEASNPQTLASLTGLAVEWLRNRPEFSTHLPDHIKRPVAQRAADRESDQLSQSSGSSRGSLRSVKPHRSDTSSQGGRSVGGPVYLSSLSSAESTACVKNRRMGRVFGSLVVSESEYQRQQENGLWGFRYLGVQPYVSEGVATGVLTAGLEGKALRSKDEPLWSLGIVHYMDMVGRGMKPSGDPSGNVTGRKYKGAPETLEERLSAIKATCKNAREERVQPGMTFLLGRPAADQFSAFLVQVISQFVTLHKTTVEDPRLAFLNRLKKGVEAILDRMGEEERAGYEIFGASQENTSTTTKSILPTQFFQLIFRMPAKGASTAAGNVSAEIPQEQLEQDDPFAEFRLPLPDEEAGETSSTSSATAESGDDEAVLEDDVLVQRQVIALTLSAYGEIAALSKQLKRETVGAGDEGAVGARSSSSSHRPHSAKHASSSSRSGGSSSSSSSRARDTSAEREKVLRATDAENRPPESPKRAVGGGGAATSSTTTPTTTSTSDT